MRELRNMEAFVKALEKFIFRDISYVIGGTSIIVAGSLLVGDILPSDISTPIVLFIAGIGYAIGWAVQDGLSLTGLINTSVKINTNKFLIFFWEIYTRMPWKEPPQFDPLDVYLRMYYDFPPEKVAPIERMISLSHVGNTIGANWLVCSFLLFIGSIIHASKVQFAVAISGFVVSSILMLLGWLQAMQEYVSLGWLAKRLPEEKQNKKAEQENPVDS
jgi:hypothetical protein